jgi:hypothetical protein
MTRGTRTFYLPLERDDCTPPEATLVVRRDGEDSFAAGLAVCRPEDPFHKRVGRHMAFGRLQSKELSFHGKLEEIAKDIYDRVVAISERRGGGVMDIMDPDTSGDVFLALDPTDLNKYFDKKLANQSDSEER